MMQAEFRSMMREELETMRQQIRDDVEHSFRTIIGDLQQRVQDLEEHVRQRDVSTERFRSEAVAHIKRLEPLKDAVDEISAEQRRPTLILSGGAIPPPVEQTDDNGRRLPEDVAPVIIAVINKKLPNIAITRDDIASCFRVGRTRKLVVKFKASGPHTARESLYQGRFELMKRRNVPQEEQ